VAGGGEGLLLSSGLRRAAAEAQKGGLGWGEVEDRRREEEFDEERCTL
jgi:hypothetical protein